jgi:ubiquinone/menaquinone biosynthesis C-methylase UbiE
METLETTRAAWNQIAAGYDEFVTTPGMPIADAALRRAGLRPGMYVLDVAAGCGALSIPAARLGARVLATDLSPNMLDRLRARAHAEGLSNVEGRVMDGHALDLEDNTFDIAASQFGVMLFPDLPRALGELVRVTNPGGRVLLVTYAPPATLAFLGLFIGAMHAVVPGFTGIPMEPPPLPFQVADPDKLRQRMLEAGLQAVRVEDGAETLEIQSGKHLWNWVTNSNPLGALLVADLTPAQSVAVQQALDAQLRERSGGSGPALVTNPVHIGIGTV